MKFLFPKDNCAPKGKQTTYHLKYEHMWHLGTWFFSEHGSVGLMDGLNDFKDHFQP